MDPSTLALFATFRLSLRRYLKFNNDKVHDISVIGYNKMCFNKKAANYYIHTSQRDTSNDTELDQQLLPRMADEWEDAS